MVDWRYINCNPVFKSLETIECDQTICECVPNSSERQMSCKLGTIVWQHSANKTFPDGKTNSGKTSKHVHPLSVASVTGKDTVVETASALYFKNIVLYFACQMLTKGQIKSASRIVSRSPKTTLSINNGATFEHMLQQEKFYKSQELSRYLNANTLVLGYFFKSISFCNIFSLSSWVCTKSIFCLSQISFLRQFQHMEWWSNKLFGYSLMKPEPQPPIYQQDF